jgi:hypothetical protein
MWYSSGMDQNPAGPIVAGTRHSPNTIGCQIMPENLHHNPLGLRVLSFGNYSSSFIRVMAGLQTWSNQLAGQQWKRANGWWQSFMCQYTKATIFSVRCHPSIVTLLVVFFLEQSLSISLDVRSLNHRMHLTRC